ncbi:hypothetical protein KUTeg_008128 [Tegillarca granosa]|uniref:Cyclic nucleotide-binding domain-containing protein n=1 Tax=Tegillarca granosa TaxID=220873 RepID=A0ABQ9F888_TEGGR|nr:hypothetical protein KUTeg_008128 [Tegillarca granosa]
MSGTVSVYIDPRMTGEEEIVIPEVTKEDKKKDKKKTEEKESEKKGMMQERNRRRPPKKRKKMAKKKKKSPGSAKSRDSKDSKEKKDKAAAVSLTKLDRNKFGKFIAEQEQEFKEISDFIEVHPFFCNMSSKFKKLLEMSLRKESYVFDTVMVRQGEPLIGLYFILKGEATVTVEPHKHPKQYPHLWPFEAGMDIYAMEFEYLRESRRAAILRQYEDPAVWDIIPEELAIRRTEGYAAIEKWQKERHINLCSIHEGEVIGDTEMLMNLPTNLYTIKCTANTDVFILDTKNFERLVGKRNVTTIDVMRESVISKLKTRMDTKQGNLVPLLKFLHLKLTEQILPTQKPLPPLKNSKTLPDKDVQIRQMLEWFKDGKVELVNPIVPGAYYYKELMKEKARKRENARKKLAENPSITAKIRAQRKAKPIRQPRSLAAIRESLRQMMEAEVIAMNTKDKRKLKKKKTHSEPSSQMTSNVPSEMGSRDISRASSQKDGEPPYIPKTSEKPEKSENNHLLSVKSKSQKHSSSDKQPNTKKVNITSETPRKDKDLPMIYEERTQEEIILRQTSVEGKFDSNANIRWKGRNSVDGNLDSNANAKSKNRKKSRDETDSKYKERKNSVPKASDTFITEVGNNNRLENVETLLNSKTPLNIKTNGSDEEKRFVLPPLTGKTKTSEDSSGESVSKWNIPMKFVNDRIQKRFSEQFREVTEDMDFLSSDNNLTLLENKIQAFHLKYGNGSKSHQNLPKLARFTDAAQEEEEGPKGGGKVWVKKRSCRFADNTVKVKDHSHIRHYVVPELPQFDDVRKKKHVVQLLLNGAVNK